MESLTNLIEKAVLLVDREAFAKTVISIVSWQTLIRSVTALLFFAFVHQLVAWENYRPISVGDIVYFSAISLLANIGLWLSTTNLAVRFWIVLVPLLIPSMLLALWLPLGLRLVNVGVFLVIARVLFILIKGRAKR